MAPKSSATFRDEFSEQVQEACKHYDKPERIGQLPIASAALQAILVQNPHHATDIEGRGKALCQVIDVNLEMLKPKERNSYEGEVYISLYSYIYSKDPESGLPIRNVAKHIKTNYALARGTYFKRQEDGIKRLCSLLSGYLSQRTTWLEPVPSLWGFIGREAELADYREQLEAHRFAVIEGIGGVGKSALAAKLAHDFKLHHQEVCWLTIRPDINDNMMGLLRTWAAFLAQNDYHQLWAFMSATATEPKSLTEYFPLLRQGLAKVQPLLCVDRLELLPDGDAASRELLEMVRKEPNSRLLLISRRRPSLTLPDYLPLTGLKPTDVERFMKQRKIALTSEQLERVMAYTLGNPRLLKFWLTYMDLQGLDVSNSLRKLGESEAVGFFLTTQIVGSLEASQQRAASLLALTRSPLDSFFLQEPALSDLSIKADDFSTLQRFRLIHQTSAEKWSLSPLLSDYLKPQLMPAGRATREAIALHLWLAQSYSLQGNVLEAAYHAIQGRETEQGILWLAQQEHSLIKEGHAPTMSTMLKPIQVDKLNVPVRQVLRDLRIEFLQLLGDYDAAESEAQAAKNEAMTEVAQAGAERALGEVAKRRGNLWQAINHYEQALQLLDTKEITLEAWLHRDLAWALAEQNKINEAWHEVKRIEISLKNTYGTIAKRTGNFEQARDAFEEGITMAEEFGEYRELLRLRNNLALLYLKKKQVRQAISLYRENLDLNEEIGELVGKAITLMNLGVCHTQIGLDEPQKAIDYFRQALPTFSTLGDTKGQMLANFNLAEQYQRLGQLDEAHQHIKAAISVDKKIVPTTSYAEAQRIYAEILLAQNKRNDALAAGQEALATLQLDDQSESFTDPLYAKLACETLARIHKARGEVAEGENYQALAERLQEQLG